MEVGSQLVVQEVDDGMSEASVAAIDEKAFASLEDIADGDAEFIAEVLNQFLMDAEILMATLLAGAEAGNAQEVEHSAHTLRSASANVGALRLSRICQELQEMGRVADPDGCGERAAVAREEFAQVKRELHRRLEKTD